MSTAVEVHPLVERFSLKALVESCLVVEDGVAAVKDVETGMMMGAGILPGPFARADEMGLDVALEALSRAEAEWGENFAAPVLLKRLVAQGRLGKKTGQGFFPYPADGLGEGPVLLEERGDVGIIWLNKPPANPLSPEVIGELMKTWQGVDGRLRAVVFASSNIFTFCAGADIKAFTKMDPAVEGKALLESAHAFMRSMEKSSTVTIASFSKPP